MKRSEIIKQLMTEGFSEKTLVNFSDKQLASLSSRILSEQTTSTLGVKNIKSTNTTAINDAKRKGETFSIYRESTTPGLKSKKEVKECEGKMPGLTSKKTNGELSHGTVKEEGPMPGLTVKKTTGKLGRGTVKEEEMTEKKPSAGLSAKKKSEVVKKAKSGGDIGKKGKEFKDVEAAAKKGGAKDPKAVAAAAMWKNIRREEEECSECKKTETTDKKKSEVVKKSISGKDVGKKGKEINEWVENVAKKHYHPFTSKSEIMEMISSKMEEMNEIDNDNKLPGFLKAKAIKSRGEVGTMTAPAQPKTKPGVKPDTRPGERPRKNPYQPPFPRKDPHPKAINPETVMPSEVAESKKIPVIKPGQKK